MKRHAYIIMAHNEPEILEALLRMLDDERNDIFLHIDRKAHAMRQRFAAKRLSHARLFVDMQPLSVYWAHTSVMGAELKCLRTAAAHGPYERYHLLSGVDLPLKTQDEIRHFFAEHETSEMVGFWNAPKQLADATRRTRYYYVLNRTKGRGNPVAHALTAPVRNLLLAAQKVLGVRRKHGDWEIRKGPQWFSITQACCEYVLRQEKKLWQTFRFTLCPDELFMQTALWNSPFRDKVFDASDAEQSSVRAIDWTRGNPYVWQDADVPQLLASPYLFARKFSSTHMKAVRHLEETLSRTATEKA